MLNIYPNVSNLLRYINISSCQLFFSRVKAGYFKLLHVLLALPQLKNHNLLKCNHHVKPFLKKLNLMFHLVWGRPTPPIRQKANCTSWYYHNQIFDCIMTLIIWVHQCSNQFCGGSINISVQSIIHTQFLKLLKLDGKLFLTASLSGHTIRFFNKTDRGFIHFQKIFDTFASLRLNRIAKSGFIKPSFSFIKTRNKWFLYPKCWTIRLMLGLITWSNHINNFEPATPVRNCKSLSLLFSHEKNFSLCFKYLIWAFFSLTRFFNKYVFLIFCLESVCLLTSSVWVPLSATVLNSICSTQSGTECSSSKFT